MTLNPADYVSCSVSGLDGEGVLSLSFDYDSLLADMQVKKDLTQREIEEILSLIPDAEKDFSISAGTGLSNGDVVTVKSAFETKVLSKYKVVFKNDSIEYTVEGLTEISNIAINDYIALYLSGFDGDGYGTVEIDAQSLYNDVADRIRAVDSSQEAEDFITYELYSYLSITSNPYYFSDLSNGDTIAFTLELEYTEIEEYGIRFTAEDVQMEAAGLAPTETISLEEYLSVTWEGYDGAGSPEIALDTEKLTSDLEALFAADGRDSYGAADSEEASGEDAADVICGAWESLFECVWSKDSGFSNGDEVTLSFSAGSDSYYLSNVGIYLQSGSLECTVEGLTEPREVDLADAVVVSVEGVCPDLYLEVGLNADRPYVDELSLEGPESGWISAVNGDRFTWTVIYDETSMLQRGYKVTNNVLTYEIYGLPVYDFTFDSMECQAVSELGDAALTWVTDVIAQNPDWLLEQLNEGNTGWFRWDSYEVAIESARKMISDGSSYYNQLYVICHAVLPMVQADGSSTDEDIYFVMMRENIIEEADGSITISDDSYDWYTTSTSLEEIEASISEMSQSDGSVEEYELEGNASEAETESSEETVDEEAATETDELSVAVTAEAPALSEEAASRAAAVISYDGHTYARIDEALTWEEAEELCESLGGTLATVTSATESAIIEQLLADSPYGEYWLGASETAEGSWKWVTGEAFEYTDWNGNQPDNYNETENCVTVGSDFRYNWNDRNDDYEGIGFILELSSESSEAGYLTDLTPVNQENTEVSDYVQDPYGGDHYSSLSLNAARSAWIVYSLNGEYEALTATISTWTEADSNASFEMLIVADGKTLYSLSDYTKTDEPVDLQLDLTGVDKLEILTYDRAGTGNAYLFLNEAKLTPAAEETTVDYTVSSLDVLPVVDSVNYSYSPYLWRDVYGDMHSSSAVFGANTGDVLWNLDGEYSGLSGIFTVSAYSFNEETSVSIEILADGETVYALDELDKFQGVQPFEVDLTGVETLEILVTVNDEEEIGHAVYVYLADAVLTAAASAGIETEEPVFPKIDESYVSMASEQVTYGNYQYYRFDIEMTWQEAAEFCEKAGGSLLCITDEEKQSVAYYLASEGIYDEYWIGGSRVSVSTAGDTLTADEEESVILGEEETLIVSEEETYGDEWEWVNGEAFDYTNWRDGEPNNSGGTEYLAAIRDDGKWNDCSEDYLTGFIMEVEAESGQTETGDAALTSLEWSDSNKTETWTSVLDSQGDLHFSAIAMNTSGNAWLLCDVNGEYASMTGTLSVYAGAEDGVSLEIGIFGDGELLYEISNFTKNMEAETFTVDLTGVKTLIIVTGNEGNSGDAYLLMSETKLTLADEANTGELVQRLGDQTVVDSSGGLDGSSVGLFTDAWGEFHSSYISMNAATDTYILYNLNSGLSILTGTLTTFADTSRDMTATVTFYDYSSGEVLGQYLLSKDGGSVPVEIDISGVSTLMVVVETPNEVNNAWIALTDDRLLP